MQAAAVQQQLAVSLFSGDSAQLLSAANAVAINLVSLTYISQLARSAQGASLKQTWSQGALSEPVCRLAHPAPASAQPTVQSANNGRLVKSFRGRSQLGSKNREL